MSVAKAVAHYKGEGGHQKLNCAEAVAVAFKEKFQLSDQDLSAFGGCGGGRAPGGVCGAWHAARVLLARKDPARIKECEEAFQAEAGALQCREIRALKRLPCAGCVDRAAGFVARNQVRPGVKCNASSNASSGPGG